MTLRPNIPEMVGVKAFVPSLVLAAVKAVLTSAAVPLSEVAELLTVTTPVVRASTSFRFAASTVVSVTVTAISAACVIPPDPNAVSVSATGPEIVVAVVVTAAEV